MPRSITAALEEHFGQDCTTTAVCWRIERRDGTVLGFTNHDVSIEYGGVTYSPFSSADLTNLEQLASTAADNLEIKIAFDSEYITKEDVQKGKYDHAEMYIFMLNYADTSMGIVKLVSGFLGTAELNEYGGKTEMMSLGNLLQTEIGEYYSYKCRATLGDSRCKVNLEDYKVTGSVTNVTSDKVFADTSRTEEAGWFKYGYITFTSGLNDGWTREIKAFASGEFTLLFAFPFDVAETDTYEAYPGCSNYPSDCKTKYSNFINYRGEPHLPGRDEISKFPDAK